ncbi:low affinity immunoglobulin gamma Fc region receptor III-like [Agelaius tricolor]|uniref:low affinity immunoglobulin gamma Fc region receptor III-like n=1 Tax=Agelaius tricolor TaxID=9191 RepID=UPI0039F2636C
MAGDIGMARKVALLLWGVQSTQLLVEPPWRPVVLWDRVTLTCQGLGTTGATTWYKDGQRWGQEQCDNVSVTGSVTYMCERPDTRCSPPMTILNDWLVLQEPAQALLVGNTVTLHCWRRQNKVLKAVYFYREEMYLRGPQDWTKLSLKLHHSGRYLCGGQVVSQWRESEQVTVTVHSECKDGDRET